MLWGNWASPDRLGISNRDRSTLVALLLHRDRYVATLELNRGSLDLETADIGLRLLRSLQTVAALRPKTTPDFDFTPGDRALFVYWAIH